MTRKTRPIAWIKAARKDFEVFPSGARQDLARALTVVGEGGHPDIAKPLTGFGSGVLELALKHRRDAFRVVYALQMGDDIWIVHAFQKKSKSGIRSHRYRSRVSRPQCTSLRRGGFPDQSDHAEPCPFLSRTFPVCSIIRPTSNFGAVAALTGLAASGLFIGQSKDFFQAAMALAVAADAATRKC